MTPASAKPQADLKTRAISAAVMLVVAGSAIFAGGAIFEAFAILIGLGLAWEWRGISGKITAQGRTNPALQIGGLIYIGLAVWALIQLRETPIDLIAVIASVIATDTGAYFAGRAIGGPKIAPNVSPSKTWAGLAGGMLASGITMAAVYEFASDFSVAGWVMFAVFGGVLAIVAQAGDFLESAMKRKAEVKDSSHLIPGHGGLLDRLDGLLAVAVLMLIVKLLVG